MEEAHPPKGILKRQGMNTILNFSGKNFTHETSISTLTGSKNSTRSVMFSDGVRPGGDLAASLDPPKQLRTTTRMPRAKKNHSQHIKPSCQRNCRSFAHMEHLPIADHSIPGGFSLNMQPKIESMIEFFNVEKLPSSTVEFAVNIDLRVMVQCCRLDYADNPVVWSFSTKGFRKIGQDEIVLILQR